MMKRILASLLALALVVALAACGYGTSATVSSDNEPINTQDDYDSQYENAPSVEAFVEQESNEVFTDPAPEEPESLFSTYDGSIGPIVITGSYNRYDGISYFDLIQVNVSNGEMVRVYSFANMQNFKTTIPLDPDYLPAHLCKQLFDPSLTRLAVNLFNLSDGSQHVGWVDFQGVFTDVTNIVHLAGDGFSSKQPQDKNALFTPSGEFFFCDKNAETYYYVDPVSLSVIRVDEDVLRDRWGTMVDVVFTWDDVLCKDFSISGSGDSTNIPVGDFNMFISHKTSNMMAFDFAGSNGRMLGIRSTMGDSLIGIYGEGINPYDDQYGGYGIDWLNPVFVRITPETDYLIEYCAYRDGRIAFTARRGDSRSLFVTDAQEGANPVEVMKLDSQFKLLFWK